MKGSKPLMSEMLDDTRRYLEQAEKTDVSKLRDFLMTEPDRPMIVTGQGGSIPPAEYAAILYSSHCSIGKAMSCYDTHSVSDTAMQNAKLLLVSKGGGNIDVKAFKKRAESINKQHFHLLSTGKLGFEFPDGFISIPNVITNFALLYKAFTGDADIVSKLALSQRVYQIPNFLLHTISYSAFNLCKDTKKKSKNQIIISIKCRYIRKIILSLHLYY